MQHLQTRECVVKSGRGSAAVCGSAPQAFAGQETRVHQLDPRTNPAPSNCLAMELIRCQRWLHILHMV
jgi:hypothetical protein